VLSEYTSMTEARDITNCSISLISKCCNRKSYYTVNNSTFRYSTLYLIIFLIIKVFKLIVEYVSMI
jgi:hypothetical protein